MNRFFVFSFCSVFLIMGFSVPAHAFQEGFESTVTPRNISAAVGAKVYGKVLFENPSSTPQIVTIFLSGADGGEANSAVAPFDSVRFFDAVPEDFVEDFTKNSDVSTLCRKRDASEDLDAWCDGAKSISIEVENESSLTVPFVFSARKESSNPVEAYVIVSEGKEADISEKDTSENKDRTGEVEESDEEEARVISQKISYVSPVKKVIAAEISSLTLSRSFGALDVFSWMRAGFQETYDAKMIIVNRSSEELSLTASVVADRSGKEQRVDREVTLGKDEEKEVLLSAINVERFGTTFAYAQLDYVGSDGPYVVETDRARISTTPLKEAMSGAFLLAILFVGGRFAMRLRSAGPRKQKSLSAKDPNGKDDVIEKDVRHMPESIDSTGRMQSRGRTTKTTTAKKATKKRVVSTSLQERDVAEHTTIQEVPRRSQPVQKSSGMDLEWMQEDERVFDDAMRAQERSVNVRVGLLAVLAVIGFLFFVFFVFGQLFFGEDEAGSSITSLTNDAVDVAETKDIADADSLATQEESIPEEPATQEESVTTGDVPAGETNPPTKKETTQPVVSTPGEVKVRVLNGSGVAGVAGKLTTQIAGLGYETLTPSNASRSYAETIIYHAEGAEPTAKALAKSLGTSYKEVLFEESAQVLTKHEADVVVVIGTEK